MKSISELIHAHVGRPALVMGGGLSLPEQVSRAPEGCIKISANQHGALLMPCDYVVSCDDLSHKELKRPDGSKFRIRDLGIPILSSRRSIADFVIMKHPVTSTGPTAAWCAWVLGCAPILATGMDCYVGGTYYHDHKAQSSGTHVKLADHLKKWEALRAKIPGAMIRSMGGPLAAIFPAYDPEETATPGDRAEIERQARGNTVRVLKRWQLAPRPFLPGDKLEVNQAELDIGLRKRLIVREAA